MFRNRKDAGQGLAEQLEGIVGSECVIEAIPRGGVVVAGVVADRLNAPLDVIVPRKLPAPQSPELAIGAVAEGGVVLLNHYLIGDLDIDEEYIERVKSENLDLVERRVSGYRQGRPPISVEGKTAVLIDDGLATGFTALASVASLRKRNPARIILAVPVSPKETLKRFEQAVDEVICLETPVNFFAVGQFYDDFEQTQDSDVIAILKGHDEKVRNRDSTDRRRSA